MSALLAPRAERVVVLAADAADAEKLRALVAAGAGRSSWLVSVSGLGDQNRVTATVRDPLPQAKPEEASS